MRLWSIHPKYLDAKGLVALWRETLLAKKVLEGKTRGYTNHPQLTRFKNSTSPIEAINKYLSIIYEESLNRKYNFDVKKIDWSFNRDLLIAVSEAQINYEFQHLLRKIEIRDPEWLNDLPIKDALDTNPLFYIVPGEIESWEKAK